MCRVPGLRRNVRVRGVALAEITAEAEASAVQEAEESGAVVGVEDENKQE